MGATFSRLKSWIAETLTYSDLNAEIDNILNNLDPTGVGNYSNDSTQMQIQTSPGALGSESLPTSLAGELARLRYVIKRMIGSSVTYWYENPSSTLTDIVNSIGGGGGLPNYRISSGRTTGRSSQMCALIPVGTAASVILSASTVTPFVYYIAGTQYSITANQTLSSLNCATAAGTTAAISHVSASSNYQWTRLVGMYPSANMNLSAASVGAAFTSAAGTIAAFRMTSGEYFTGFVDTTISLIDCWRGGLFDSSANSITAQTFSIPSQVFMQKMAWIFANSSSALTLTYNNPTFSSLTPTGAAFGDYWYDLGTTAWRTFNAVTWDTANVTLIGFSVQNATACVAARTFDSYKPNSGVNTLQLDLNSLTPSTSLQARERGAEVSVFGSSNRFFQSRPIWDYVTHLESGQSAVTADQTLYWYMKEDGSPVVSDRAPLLRRDLYGYYHPAETWRCLAVAYNNPGGSLVTPTNLRESNYLPIMGNVSAYTLNNAAAFPTQNPYGVFPNKIFNQSDIAVGYTSAGNFQPCSTIAFTRGLWLINAAVNVSATGTPSATGLFVAQLTSSDGTAAAADVSDLYNQPSIGLSAVANGRFTQQINGYLRYFETTTNLQIRVQLTATAGATYTATGRVVAQRMDDLGGLP